MLGEFKSDAEVLLRLLSNNNHYCGGCETWQFSYDIDLCGCCDCGYFVRHEDTLSQARKEAAEILKLINKEIEDVKAV